MAQSTTVLANYYEIKGAITLQTDMFEVRRIVRLALEHRQGHGGLFVEACRDKGRDTRILHAIIDSGLVSINEQQSSPVDNPMRIAMERDDLDLLMFLLSRQEYDLNAQYINRESTCLTGRRVLEFTPPAVYLALRYRRDDYATLIMSSPRFDPAVTCPMGTVLSCALYYNCVGALNFLLENTRANVNLRDDRGLSIMHELVKYEARQGMKTAIHFATVIEGKSKIPIKWDNKDNNGITPWFATLEENCYGMFQWIAKHPEVDLNQVDESTEETYLHQCAARACRDDQQEDLYYYRMRWLLTDPVTKERVNPNKKCKRKCNPLFSMLSALTLELRERYIIRFDLLVRHCEIFGQIELPRYSTDVAARFYKELLWYQHVFVFVANRTIPKKKEGKIAALPIELLRRLASFLPRGEFTREEPPLQLS